LDDIRHDLVCGRNIYFDCHHMGYLCNQDCKCYDLSQRNRKYLFSIDLTPEQGKLMEKRKR
jgi:hypothetical protein